MKNINSVPNPTSKISGLQNASYEQIVLFYQTHYDLKFTGGPQQIILSQCGILSIYFYSCRTSPELALATLKK
jgi:hypothetical protein